MCITCQKFSITYAKIKVRRLHQTKKGQNRYFCIEFRTNDIKQYTTLNAFFK